MITITGIEQTIQKLRNASKRYEELTVTKAYQNFVRTVFNDIVAHTPQWSGNLATNWRVEVGKAHQGHGGDSQISNYKTPAEWTGNSQPYKAGDAPATFEAEDYNDANFDRIKWNSRVSIVNYAPYAAQVEAGIGPKNKAIRTENKFSGPFIPAHGVAMVAYAEMKYNNLKYRNFGYRGMLR